MLRLALVVALAPSVVVATSQGVGTSCDAWGNFGCNNWTVSSDGIVNRLQCIEVTQGPMPWAMKPERSTFYTVRAGDGNPAADLTDYVPGEYISIYIRTLQYGYTFRGLLIHAVNGTGDSVGEWANPTDAEASLYWTPPQCPNAAMHVSAELKPYSLKLTFKGPPKGHGPLTFRTLLKRGVANNGWFHRPSVDLVLQEAGASNPKWFAANVGEACSATCQRVGRGSVDTATMEPALGYDGAAWGAAIQRTEMCAQPIMSTCASSTPLSTGGFCYFPANTCPAWRPREGDVLNSANEHNLCACAGGSTVRCPPGSSFVNGQCSVSPAGTNKASLSLVTMLAAVVMATTNKRSNLLLVGLLAVALLMPTASAHNWLHTPGRASFQASTVSPCQGRKASDLHAQVSRNQDIVFKWAVGHDRNTYWVILAGKDADWLSHPDFEIFLEDYIANAPANDAFTAGKMRLHGVAVGVTDFSQYDASTGAGAQYNGKLQPTDAGYLSHPRAPGNVQYTYKPAAISDDKRVSYVSTKYPWIEAVFRYEHTYHLPNDYDVFSTKIPGRSGDGHYIVHWRWSGYYDCVDVDVRAADVAQPYGVISAGFIYSRIDHCRYETPKQIVSHCIEATISAQPCVDQLPSWMDQSRLGINIQPLKLPDTVYKDFRALNNIPWNDQVCAGTSWTVFDGTVTETPINWNNWKKTFTANTKCTSIYKTDYTQTTDLKRAIAACIGIPNCKGIQWAKNVNVTALPTTGQSVFSFCTGTGTAADTGFSTAFIPTNLQTYTDGTATSITVSFGGPKSVTSKIVPPANTFVDQGDAYGPRTGGQTFGWNCAQGIKEDCCAQSWNSPTIENTFMAIAYDCDGVVGKPQQWEIAVANGVYTVQTYHNHFDANTPTVDVSGCNVEGVMITTDGVEQPKGVTLTRRNVEVLDGRLTLDGAGACWTINYITITKVRNPGLNEIWLPAVSNPTYQIALGKTEKVGVITVRNFAYSVDDVYSCPVWWFFRGATCPDARPLGWFNDTATQGIKVGVSNSPCSGSGCGGTVCGIIQAAQWWQTDYAVDCKGAEGSYVWVWAPGSARIFVGEVIANRFAPVVEDNPLICYGLEAREQTQTTPEFVTTYDPEDPLFYSTCITREPAITWLDIPTAPAPSARWRFNGHCLNCSTYYGNIFSDPMKLPGPWEFSDGDCMNCAVDVPPLAPEIKWNRHAKGQCADDDAAHKSCPTGTTCQKRLYARGRTPDDDWRSWQVSLDECKVLVARDPECSDEMIWANRSWGDECSCYKKVPACCGHCTPVTWDNDASVYTREPESMPDPTCATGLKDSATAAKVCCPSHCIDSSNKTTCGALWNCYSNPKAGGSCCEPTIVGSCSVMGPPCRL